jgi:hypothetical protein
MYSETLGHIRVTPAYMEVFSSLNPLNEIEEKAYNMPGSGVILLTAQLLVRGARQEELFSRRG